MSSKDLQKQKLELEIKELNRHWLKNPNYLQVLLPTTLAIFSLLYALTSGLFSSKQELLELNKKQLETDITSFQKQKDNLTSTNNMLKIDIRKYNDSLRNKDLILKKYENSFTKEREKINSLNEEVEILKSTRNNYNLEISTLEKEYNNKKQTYLKEIESKYYKEIDNDKSIKTLNETNKNLNQTISDLKYNVEIFKSNPYIQKGKQYDFNIWALERMSEYYSIRSGKSDKEIQRLKKEREKREKRLDSLNVKGKILKIE
jgi:chromosome segregation ATPase